MSEGLPSLGRRGGGWVALQFALLALALLLGVLDVSGWDESVRGGFRTLGVLGISAGVVLAVYSVVGLGSSLTAMPAPLDGAALKTGGAYAWVRHPIYTSLLLIVLGWCLLTTPWVLIPFGLLAVVLDAKRQVEERWLLATYPEYSAYRARVRWALVPFVR
jgi:protein-S-isoprenylcysteine O-methyltransferase Ste14